MRCSAFLTLGLAFFLTLGLLATGCHSTPTGKFAYKMPGGKVEKMEYDTRFSPVAKKFLTPDQWNAADHQAELAKMFPPAAPKPEPVKKAEPKKEVKPEAKPKTPPAPKTPAPAAPAPVKNGTK